MAVVLTDRGRELQEQALAVLGAIVDRLGMDVDGLLALRARLAEVVAAKAAMHADPDRRTCRVSR